MKQSSRRSGLAALVAAICLASLCGGPLAHATGGNQGPLWTHASGSENWVGRVVSLGNDGTQVFSALHTMSSRTRLFSAHDANPPAPILEQTHSGFAYRHAVASAPHTGVHALLQYENPENNGPNVPVLRRYSSANVGADWSWSFPIQVYTPNGGVGVSTNGNIVVAWVYHVATGNTAIVAITGTTGTEIAYRTLQTYGEPKAGHISADGRLLYLATNVKSIIIDPVSGEIVHEQVNWEGVTDGHAFSADGSVFAEGLPNGRIRVHARQANGYQLQFTHQLPAQTVCNNVGLSGDGSLLVCAYGYYPAWLDVGIRALNLRQPGWPVVLQDLSVGAGTYANIASSMSVAADGSAFVVGLWGDEQGLAPELRVYTLRDGRWRLNATHDLPGSVNDVAMAPDGRAFAAASKAIHATQAGGGGRIDLFAVGEPGLLLHGIPNSGSDVVLRHYTTPGSPGRVLFAPRLGTPPTYFPGVGTLYLDRPFLGALPVGIANGQGVIETSYAVPADPSLVGTSIYFQGLSLSPRLFTDNWVKLTILP